MSAPKSSFRVHFSRILGVTFTGIALGTLVGLSASPIVEGVVTSLLVLAGAAVAALAGVEIAHGTEEPPAAAPGRRYRLSKVNVGPIALFSVCLSSAACGGSYIRSNHLLGLNPLSFSQKWAAATGLTPQQIALLYFNSSLSTEPQGKAEKAKEPSPGRDVLGGMLFDRPALPNEQVVHLLTATDEETLRSELQHSLSNDSLGRMSLEELTALRNAICGAPARPIASK